MRRIVIAAVVALSLTGIGAGYGGSRVLAWQMFPEGSRWEAAVLRVTGGGERVDIRDPWPGGYRWADLVTESGLSTPWREGHAAYGIDVTLEALQHALDWVAANTPQDHQTVYLEATVRYRRNADPVRTATLRSELRERP